MKNINKGDVVYYVSNNNVCAGIVTDCFYGKVEVNKDTQILKEWVYTDRKLAELVCMRETSVCHEYNMMNMYFEIVKRNDELIDKLGLLPEGISSNTLAFKGDVFCCMKTVSYDSICIMRTDKFAHSYKFGFNIGDNELVWVDNERYFVYNLDAVIELNKHLEKRLREVVEEMELSE